MIICKTHGTRCAIRCHLWDKVLSKAQKGRWRRSRRGHAAEVGIEVTNELIPNEVEFLKHIMRGNNKFYCYNYGHGIIPHTEVYWDSACEEQEGV